MLDLKAFAKNGGKPKAASRPFLRR